jgi:hypothetical protein
MQYYIKRLRCWLIRKLVGDSITVLANIERIKNTDIAMNQFKENINICKLARKDYKEKFNV